MARELQQENVRGKKVKGHAKDDGKKTTNSPKTDRGRIKSPSDTTLYSPALRQVNEDLTDIPRILFDQTGMTSDKVGVLNSEAKQSKANPEDFNASASIQEISNQISKCIEGIRLQNEHLAWVSSDNQPGTSGANRESHDDAQSEHVKQMEEAKRKTDKLILDVEHFRATVDPPPSRVQNQMTIQVDHNLDVDDQFFHITCHVDEALKGKIARGEFVALEKLLLKGKYGGRPNAVNEHKLDLVYRDGQSFFIPSAASDIKITGICKWEQAFRIYAAIYSQHNPHRAAEIWQYVHIINTAASAYVWENVANYDYTFRQLMSTYPQHSWAKIYNQMWNILLRKPLTKNNYKSSNQFRQNSTQSSSAGASGGGGTGSTSNANKKKKPDYCWTFNKGQCKDGAKCRFVNRCSYCDAAEHGIHACPKAKKAGVTLVSQLKN